MNEKKKRILVGLVAGSALSLSLGMTAQAEEVGTDPDVALLQGETEEQTPKATTGETVKDTAGETTKETTGETTKETTGETSGETTKEISRETTGETTEETAGETSGEATKETAGETSGEATKETAGETSGEATKETAGGTSGETTKETAGEIPEQPSAGLTGETSPESQEMVSFAQHGTSAADVNQNVRVGGLDLRESANASAGWDETNKKGWRYDGSSVSMVNNTTAVEVHAEDGGVSLSVAGFNRISTLYADGDVNITGTGIVLIDSIDMLTGTNLNLLTNTGVYEDGAGSAAVFLKNERGEYVLINGSVSGILDEEYTIPEGITLVVPDGGTLDMRVTTSVKTESSYTYGTTTTKQSEVHYGFTQEDEQDLDAFAGTVVVEEEGSGEEYYKEEFRKELSFSSPVLNIASGAILRLQEGSKLLMEAFRFQKTITADFAIDSINTSTLNISGTLELGGELQATSGSGQKENLLVNVSGSITGVETENGSVTGTLHDATVIYTDGAGKQDTLNLSGSECYVKAEGSGIGQINVTGNAAVVCGDGASIGGVTVQSGGLVRFAATRRDAQYQVGSLVGAYAVDSGYLTANGGYANQVFQNPQVGTGAVTIRTSGFRGNLTTTPQLKYWTGTNTAQGPAAPRQWTVDTLTYTQGQQVSFASLNGSNSWGGFACYEVYTYDSTTGQVRLNLLKNGSAESLDAGQILEIRGVDFLDADDASVTVGGQYLNGATDSGWNGGSGWRYNGSTISMVNNAAANDIYAEAMGVELNVAGLNRIGLLYADGDVNITGSGIVLIDSIDLLYGKKLNLLTNTDLYENGSAAVFLKNASGAYELINGSVPGILDEEYTIPEGVTLVMPDGSVLELRVTASVKDSAGNTQTGYGMSQSELAGKTPGFSVPVLNIGKNATLKVENGAQLRLDAFRFRKDTSGNYTINTGTLKVAGLLDLAGSITRFGSCPGAEDDNLLLRVENGGRVTGSGSLTDATVIYAAGAGSQDTLNVSGKSYVQVGSSGIGQLNAAGDTTVICAEGVSIGTVSGAQGATIRFSATQRINRYSVGTLTGDYTVESGYLTVGGSYAGDHASLTAPTNPIPVVKGTLGGEHVTDVSHLDYWTGVSLPQLSDRPTNTGWKTDTIKHTAGGSVDYDTLHQLDKCAGYAYYEVYSRENGKLQLHLLKQGSSETVVLANIVKIVGVNLSSEEAPENGIYVGSQKLGNGSKDWTDATAGKPGSGWRYDGTSVSLVNNSKPVDIQAVGGGVDLSVAGLNLVGVLSADADVNITGTGLILIDRIDLAVGKQLNLKTNTKVYSDGTGSAAVFLYDQEAGVYRLINGTVPGILDESYTLPDGVTLVIPRDGVLDLRTTTQVTTTITAESNGAVVGKPETHYGITDEDRANIDALDEPKLCMQDGQVCYMRKTLTVSKASLTVPISSVLRVENGGKIKLESLFIEATGTNNRPYRYRANCALNLNGSLELNGTVERTGNPSVTAEVSIRSTGKVTGAGTMSGVRVNFPGKQEGNLLHIVGDGIKLDVEANEIRSIGAAGATSVFFGNGASIGGVSTSGTGTITFYALSDPHDRLNITTSYSGACTINSGCVYVNGNYRNESFTNPGANVGTTIPIETETNDKAIIYSVPTTTEYGFSYIKKNPGDSFTFSQSQSLPLENEVTFTYNNLSPAAPDCNVFEFFVRDTTTGKVTVYIVDDNSSVWVKPVTDDAVYLMENIDGKEVKAGKVFLIRGLKQNIYPNAEYNGSFLNPGTSNTGSGILGGGEAGSLTGGNSSGILPGTRLPGSTGSGTASNTDTTNTGSGILVGGGSLTGGNSSGILPGNGTRPMESGDNGTVSDTDTTNTGSGLLGDGSSLNGGSAVSVLTGNRKPPAPPAESQQPGKVKSEPDSNVRVELKVAGSGTEYTLSMYYDGVRLKELGEGTVKVSMEFRLPDGWDGEDLFAVFRDENGELVAVKAHYNPVTGLLEFDAPMLGDFQLVCFDWDGTDLESPAFLAALKAHMNE